jgi:hypothetical protein
VQTTDSGTVPTVGAECPRTGNEDGTDSSVTKLITNVDLISSSSTEALFANWSGLTKQLTWPVPVEATPVA